MTSSNRTAAKILEAAERIYDPETIEAKLSGLSSDQKSLLMRLYKSSRATATAAEARQRIEIIKLFQATAEEIEADIFKVFRSMPGDAWDYNSVRRVGRDKQLLDQINNRLRALDATVKGSLGDGLLDSFKRTWLDSAYRLDVLTPSSSSIKFGLLPDREIAAMLNEPWSGARFSDRLGLITDDAAHRVKQEIVKSMMAGEAWGDTARRIRSEMGTGGQKAVWRAEMVARTELAHAQELANTELYAENEDVIDEVVWIAHPGACEKICKPKHGLPVSVVGVPPDDSHPNCVCDQLAIPRGWDGLARDGDDDFSIRPVSRKEWSQRNNLPVV